MNVDSERLEDLLLKQALLAPDGSLDTEEHAELERLRRQDPAGARELEAAVTSAVAASWSALAEDTPMPDSLERRLTADAERFFAVEPTRAGRAATAAPGTRAARPWAWVFGGLGWAVAATLALALLPDTSAPVVDERAALMETSTDTVLVAWARSAVDGYEAAGGDVLWSDDAQRGVMRLVDLPPNDPSRSQYQLWIVDPARDAVPVDGGVFDVPGEGETIVQFEPRLPVRAPTTFAITREQPGGVVVSEGPLLLVADAS